MISNFFRLAIRQMDVQLRMRVLSLWSLGLLFVQPAIFSAIGMLLARAAGNANPDLIYTVLGGGIMGMWSGLVFTSTYDIRADRREGTLELIVGSPTPLRRVVGFRSLLNILAGSTSVIAAVATSIAGSVVAIALMLVWLREPLAGGNPVKLQLLFPIA